VKPVLKMKEIVKFVLLTDLTHHLVDVLEDSIKTKKKKPVPNVKNVVINVPNVKTKMITVTVHVQLTESTVQHVNVNTDSTIFTNKPNVNLVTINTVDLVSLTKKDVLIVLKTESNHQLVIVEKDYSKTKMKIVKFVDGHVKNVPTN